MAALRPSVLHGRLVTVTFAPLPGFSRPKAAAVVSKKVALRAVDRNRIQRRVRDILRPHILLSQEPLAIIVRAKKEALSADMAALRADLEPIIARIMPALPGAGTPGYNAR